MVLKREIETENSVIQSNATQDVGVTGFIPVLGKYLTVSKTIELTSSDDTSVATLPAGAKTLLATDGSAALLTHIPVTA